MVCQMRTDMQTAYQYAVARLKDTNPYYNVIEELNRVEPSYEYTLVERVLVLLMSMVTDFAAAVLVAVIMRGAPNEEDCNPVADVWQCTSTETMSVEQKLVVELTLTIIFATVFSTVLGGSALQKGFRIECCCQWILYVWLVIILAVASIYLLYSLDFSEECKFGCYKCATSSCDQCLPPYVGDLTNDVYYTNEVYCQASFKIGAVESAILWGTTQFYHNSLFILPQETLLTFFRMKVGCIPCIGIDEDTYVAPDHKWLKVCCERNCCKRKTEVIFSSIANI